MTRHSLLARAGSHSTGVLAQAVLVAAIAALAALALSPVLKPAASIAGVGTTSAASTSWIALRGAAALRTDGPSLGSTVSFETGYPKTVKSPRVVVKCYQDGVLTFAAADSADASFLLGGGGSVWLSTGGSASCVGELFYYTYKGRVQSYHWLASTDPFEAAG